jgi:hypothetical protein
MDESIFSKQRKRPVKAAGVVESVEQINTKRRNMDVG